MSFDPDRGPDSEAARLPGILMVAGMAIFIATVIGAPVLRDFFEASEVEEQALAIEEARTQWRVVWLMLMVGAMLVGVGLLRFAGVLRSFAPDERSQSLARAAGLLIIVAQLVYVIVGIYHLFASPTSIAEGDAIFISQFWIYVVILLIALAGFAYVLMRIGMRLWMAALLAVLVVVHFLQLVLTGTFLPVTVYMMLLPVGIALLVRPFGHHSATAQADLVGVD